MTLGRCAYAPPERYREAANVLGTVLDLQARVADLAPRASALRTSAATGPSRPRQSLLHRRQMTRNQSFAMSRSPRRALAK